MKQAIVGVLVIVSLCTGCTSMRHDSPSGTGTRTDIPLGSGWVIDAVLYTFNSDGSCIATADKREIKGTWRVEKDKFIATWDHGWIDTYDISGNKNTYIGVNQQGRKLTLEKKDTKATPAEVSSEANHGSPYLKPGEIPQTAVIIVSAKTPPEERFKAVRGLAISGYTAASARALADVACDKSVDETTRDYAGMGLQNFTGQLPEEDRKLIQQRLRAVLDSERGDTPDGVVRTLIAWNDAPFIHETLGEHLKGHGMEIEVLAALPGQGSCERLWQLYNESPESRKSAPYNRKAKIGRALAEKNDKRGIDVLIDLLPADHAPGHQYRHNVFVYLARKTKQSFGYNAQNYDAALEDAIPKMVVWWQKNKGTFAFAADERRQ